jgi:MFS family permease
LCFIWLFWLSGAQPLNYDDLSFRPITQKNPTSKYEAKAVALLGLGFGLLALDRWSLATLFPQISKDLHLNYQDLGNLTGILAIAWGITAILVGRAADHFGRRKCCYRPSLVSR